MLSIFKMQTEFAAMFTVENRSAFRVERLNDQSARSRSDGGVAP
jgi:hypothetical protein